MKHFVMTGSDRPDGDSELTLASVHLHYMTAKKEVAQGSAALARFRDDLARILVTWRVRVLAGDFNMALWQVVPQLRAGGLCANMAAWCPWELQGQAAPRIDSCGMSLLGPDGGPRCLFGPTALRGGGDQRGYAEMFDLVEESAVAEGALPVKSLLGSGYPLSSYRPAAPARIARLVKWSLLPIKSLDDRGMQEPRAACGSDAGLWPTRPLSQDGGLVTFEWPPLPGSSQKLVNDAMFDPDEELFGHGAHMPLMIFFKGPPRRTMAARERRWATADARGWTAERRNPERVPTRDGGDDGDQGGGKGQGQQGEGRQGERRPRQGPGQREGR